MGSLTLAYPSIAGKTTQEQLESMRRYLCSVTEQLNLADWSAKATLTEISQAIDADSLPEAEKKTTLSGYGALKALIIKTADFAAANSETWSTKLSGSYVAISDFGKYLEKTQLTIEGNSVGIKQLYDYTAGVNNQFSVNSQQYIKTGLLYYKDAVPVYGVGVGNIETTVTDGGERVIDRTKNELVTVTPDRVSFWQDGQEVAYLSDKKLHFPSGTLEAAGAVLSGKITAAADSTFGPWTISESSIFRTANEFGGSASMYFGTSGLSIKDKFKVDANGKLTCTGAEIGGTINATDLKLDGISVQPVDILSFFWEPGVRDLQKSKNIFLTEMVDNDLLVEKYPELRGKLNSNPQIQQKYNTDDVINFDNKSMVVDWYYKKYQNGRQVLHFAKLVGDTVLQSTENDTEQKYDTLTLPDGSIVQQPAGRPMAETGLYDDGEYPFVVDALFPVEGSIAGYGYIDIGKSTQEQIDRMNQAIVKNAIMATTPRWFKRSDGSVNEQEFADWTKPFVHVDGNLGQDSLQPIPVNMLNSNYIAILQNKIEELKWTTGNTDVNNGATSSGVTAASAIAALQEASGRSSKDSTKSAYRAYARMIRMVIERIRQFYDLPRQFRIIGKRGAEQFVQYSNQGLQPQTLYGANGQPDGLRKPVFDIEVSAQKASEYASMAQNELALQFFQLGFFNPQMVDQTLATLDMMDFDGKDSIIQKVQENADLQQRLVEWQQLALALADRYDPVMGEGLAQQILQEGGQAVPQASTADTQKPEISTGETQEPKIVENARKKSEESTQPG